MTIHKIKSNLTRKPYRTLLNNQEQLVVPVVMIVEGVLNNALVPVEEFGKFPDAWNGRPVPVLHPQRNGLDVSANQPDIHEKVNIGSIYNTRLEDDKLKGEAWIDIEKAIKLGYSWLIEKLERGDIIEVSTAYFSDSEKREGEYNGEHFTEIHRNLRPDHLALLPGQTGACSVADGCGTRANSKKGVIMDLKQAVAVIVNAIAGVNANGNCTCNEGDPMTDELIKHAEQLKANEMITPQQFKMLSEMDEEQLAMISAVASALASAGGGEPAEPTPEPMAEEEEVPMAEEEKLEEMVANALAKLGIKANSEGDMEQVVANAIERQRLTDELVANEACPFDEAELKTFSVANLEKLAKSLRPADFSGRAAPATNSHVATEEVQPLVANRGLMARHKQEK